MEHVLSWIARAGVATVRELGVAFGGVCLLACLLHATSSGLRALAATRFGMAYYWFVAPGVVCHETGHAVGCLLTGTKILEYVPFRPQRDRTLGWVTHEQPRGLRGMLAQLVISSGPVWFGCAVIALATWIFAGDGFVADARAAYPGAADVLSADYARALCAAAWGMVTKTASFATWRSPWFFPYLYLTFCVASEVTLSGSDLKGMVGGMLMLVGIVFALNLCGLAGPMTRCAEWLVPSAFLLQSILLFVLLIDAAFFFLAWILFGVFAVCGVGGGGRRGR